MTDTTVVVDATAGADDGHAALLAAATASLDLDLYVVVVGDETDTTEALSRIAHDAEKLRVIHASVDDPSAAIETGIAFVGRTPNACFISAGDAPTIVRSAQRSLRALVERSALAAVLPTLQHRGEHDDPLALLLDVGTSARASADDLVQFAIMGATYERLISKNDVPKVGLLSHSRHDDGATPEVMEASRRLRARTSDFEYVGLVRANEITLGHVDVIVCEGLAGNIVIRTLEGVAATGEALLAQAKKRFMGRVGVSMLGGGIQRLRALATWENYGGAPLLGFDRTVIVTHAEAGENALLNAIRLAAKVERLGVRDSYKAAQ
ncbi:MAG: glycerol-3-phosphate acyltransferase PlsX [Bradymonadia bacterium]